MAPLRTCLAHNRRVMRLAVPISDTNLHELHLGDLNRVNALPMVHAILGFWALLIAVGYSITSVTTKYNAEPGGAHRTLIASGGRGRSTKKYACRGKSSCFRK